VSALLVYAQADAVPSTVTELLLQSTPLTTGVLIILAILSVVSWAVMIAVWRQIARATATAQRFWDQFEQTPGLDEAGHLAKVAPPSALTRLLMRAMRYVADTRVTNQQMRERAQVADSGAPVSATLTGSQIETLHLILDSEATAERDRYSRFVPWLAVIASVSPLLGLLGTVLGVIDAFMGIARQGSGSLSAVAPGVAEALIATAAALAVAIPATFGYNILAAKVNRLDSLMESFGTSVISRLVREGYI
jgi:biopolymer transport protein TolQ